MRLKTAFMAFNVTESFKVEEATQYILVYQPLHQIQCLGLAFGLVH